MTEHLPPPSRSPRHKLRFLLKRRLSRSSLTEEPSKTSLFSEALLLAISLIVLATILWLLVRGLHHG